MRARRFLMLVTTGLACASASSARGEGSADDARAWASREQEPSWVRPRELVDANKWEAGGFLLVPEAELPIFLTDPFGGTKIGQPWQPTIGYGLQWRVGFALGMFSLEPLGGYSEISRDLTIPGAGTTSASLRRGWFGGQLRFTAPGSTVSPFVALGGADNVWTSPLLARSGGRAARIDSVWAPSAHLSLGARARVLPIARLATLFVEAGVRATYFFQGDVFESDQLAVSPYIGIDVVGLAAPTASAPRGERDARR